MMWRFVNTLWLLVVLLATVELATSQNSTVVRTTKEFSKALYDTRIDAIYLQHPLTVSGEEWGFLRPDVKRRVEIRPLEHTEDFVLDLGGGSDLAFVSGPSGELHFHDLQLHGIYRLALGGSGSGGAGIIMNLFRVNAPQSIHIHNSTCCFPPEVCTSISDDLRIIVPSSKAALSALGVDSCPFPEAEEPFHTYKYYEGCVLPQEWDASKITGSIHFHNTSLSCSEKCKMNDRLQDIPVVQVSTADSRQLVAAIGGMISDPQILEIHLLGRVVVYEHQWSNPFTIEARTGTRLSIDGRLEDGSHAALAFLTNDVLIKALWVFTLQLTNIKLELESFKPGFLSKTDWKFQFCDGEDYFYKVRWSVV
ncbi:hypothetical protein BSKO_02654 [Bryopsis sp. KO-2023]|nr:hypothetical protein BSKO_02654 [Bryopsis sp. KO-2023]